MSGADIVARGLASAARSKAALAETAAATADGKAATAQQSAASADAKAVSAQQAAATADTKAATAQQAAASAEAMAVTAQLAAATADTKAMNAQQSATGADAKAVIAQQVAAAADANAATALQTANAVDAKATAAQQAAAAADSKATTAQQAASAAETKATLAQTAVSAATTAATNAGTIADEARASEPATFADFPQRTVPAQVMRLHSSGYSAPGKGGGVYVSDALCSDALASAHPRFVFRTANNRIFRLAAEGGRISVEQGGAVGDGTANDQPAIQATIDYAAAVGIGGVDFASERYVIHAVTRTSPCTHQFEPDGHPIVIRKSVRLAGIAPKRTVLDFRGRNGSDPNTDYQLVPFTAEAGSANAVWRGGGVFILGDIGWETLPTVLAVDRFEMDRLVLNGNRVRTPKSGWPVDNWPASPATGDGWDDTDRAFWIQDTHVGDVILKDVDMVGWRGEIFYGAALTQRSLHLERCHFRHTNGNAFNPSTNCKLVARDCQFGDAFQAHEDTGKLFAQYTGVRWYNAPALNFGSGPTNGLGYNYVFPTRDENANLPATLFENCTIDSVDLAAIGCWVRGKLRTVDSSVVISTFHFSDVRDIELDVDAILDRKNDIEPVHIQGPATLTEPVSGAPAGIYQKPPRDMRIRLRATRTDLARRNNRHWKTASWSGFVHNSACLVLEDCELYSTPMSTGAAMSLPKVDIRGFRHSNPTNVPADGATYSGVITSSPWVSPTATTLSYEFVGGPHAFRLTTAPPGGADVGYANNQRVRIYNLSTAANRGEGLLFRKDEPWCGMILKQDRLLNQPGDFIELRFNQHYMIWEEVDFFTRRATVLRAEPANVTVPAVSANNNTTINMAMSGALIGDVVAMACSTLPTKLIPVVRVAANDQVQVQLFNPSSTASTATTGTFRLRIDRL